MTVEELAEEIGKSVSSIKNQWKRTKENYEKKTGARLVKTGRGAAASYEIIKPEEIRALAFYDEKEAEKCLFVDDEAIKLKNLPLVSLMALMVRPDLVYRGSYEQFLEYVGVKVTKKNTELLIGALNDLESRGYIMGGSDKTTTNWFIAGITRSMEKQVGIGLQRVRICKELQEKNNMESYAPLVKVWTARDMLNEATGRECTQNEIANYTNINLQMVKKCDNILKSSGMYKIEPIYETLVFVDEDGTEHRRTHKKGTKAIMNAFYNESITDEKKNELQTQIALPFNKFVGN